MTARWRFAAALLACTTAAMGAPLEVVTVSAPAVAVKAGSRESVSVTVTVKAGFHVQANPVLNPFLIPVVLKMSPAGGFKPGAAVYPPPRHMRLSGSNEDLVVYDGSFVIQLPVDVAPQAFGQTKLEGTLRYQACDNAHCLPPRSLPVQVDVHVGRGP